MCLLKYYLFGPELSHWKTILYLDADVIVAGDLGRFRRVGRFAAVPEASLDLYGQFDDRRETRRRLASSFPPRRESFNFGVFALRPSALEPTTFLSLCRLSREMLTHAAYPDQSIANLCFSSGWERLPFRLNYNPVLANRLGIRFPVPFKPSHAGELIYHFYGPFKPWHRGHPLRKLWLRNLRLAEGIADFRGADPLASFGSGNGLESLLLELVIRFKLATRRLRHVSSTAVRRVFS